MTMADNPSDSHYDELDRLAARSLAARESAATADARQKRARPFWPWIIAGLLLAFVLGLLGSPLFERELRGQLPPQLQSESAAPADPRVGELVARVDRLEGMAGRGVAAPPLPVDGAGLGARLQSVETRAIAAETNDLNLAARLDALAAEVARTNTAVVETDLRTRDLFLLAVARRMLEAGRPLTPIERALENRFREADGAAVDALAAWTAAPQTQRTLKDRLKALQEMPEAADTRSWWDRLTARLAGLVTVRGQTAETVADMDALLARARAAMEAGDTNLAVAALDQGDGQGDLPPAVRQWLADARILVAAEDALGRLETNALESGVGSLQAPAPLAAGQPPAPAPPVAGLP
jgi:hypothetical protein